MFKYRKWEHRAEYANYYWHTKRLDLPSTQILNDISKHVGFFSWKRPGKAMIFVV